MKHLFITALAAAAAMTAAAATPAWLEADSAAAIEARTRADFPLTLKEGARQIKRLHPGVTDADIRDFIARGYVEVLDFDGQPRMHGKSPRNLGLVNPAMNGGYVGRTSPAKAARRSGRATSASQPPCRPHTACPTLLQALIAAYTWSSPWWKGRTLILK